MTRIDSIMNFLQRGARNIDCSQQINLGIIYLNNSITPPVHKNRKKGDGLERNYIDRQGEILFDWGLCRTLTILTKLDKFDDDQLHGHNSQPSRPPQCLEVGDSIPQFTGRELDGRGK